jgi:hypothetical protein
MTFAGKNGRRSRRVSRAAAANAGWNGFSWWLRGPSPKTTALLLLLLFLSSLLLPFSKSIACGRIDDDDASSNEAVLGRVVVYLDGVAWMATLRLHHE